MLESTTTDSTLPAQTEDPPVLPDKAVDDVAAAAGDVTAAARGVVAIESIETLGDPLSSGLTVNVPSATSISTEKVTAGTSTPTERSMVLLTPPAVAEAETGGLSGPTPIS